jgi:hypothetical protein
MIMEMKMMCEYSYYRLWLRHCLGTFKVVIIE